MYIDREGHTWRGFRLWVLGKRKIAANGWTTGTAWTNTRFYWGFRVFLGGRGLVRGWTGLDQIVLASVCGVVLSVAHLLGMGSGGFKRKEE